jgi:nucleotide-binding universal stress UspA family protein
VILEEVEAGVYEATYTIGRRDRITADSTACDVIVMGSHGRRGVSKLIMGSVTQKVLAHTRLPVLVFR